MDVGRGVGGAAVDLLLCALRIRQHHRPRDGDVHPVPGGDDGRGGPRCAGGPWPGVLLEPQRVADTLWHDPRPDLFRRTVCDAAGMVADRVSRVAGHHTVMGRSGCAVVEGAGVVVIELSS